MPQLDVLTYFSQYVYLLITFIAVYYFVLSFIIPETLSTLKIRQKLNSLNEVSGINNVNSSSNLAGEVRDHAVLVDSSQILTATFNKHYSPTKTLPVPELNDESSSTPLLQYDKLLYNSWIAGTSRANVAESTNQWLMSAAALQLSQNMRLRKLLCSQIVRKLAAH